MVERDQTTAMYSRTFSSASRAVDNILSHTLWDGFRDTKTLTKRKNLTNDDQTVAMMCCPVTKSCLSLCDPMDCSTPGFPVLHCLPEFAQTHVHWVGDAIQPSRPLSPPSPSIFPIFSSESALHIRVPKYCSFSFSISPSKEYSGLISFRIDWFDLLAILGTQESSPAQQFESINSSVLFSVLLYGPTLTFIHQFNSVAQSCLTVGLGDRQGSLGCCSPCGHNIHTQLREKPQLWLYGPLLAKWCLCFSVHCLDLS